MANTTTAAHHAARTVIHRWFAFLEREDGDSSAAQELLAEDLLLKATFGTAQGRPAALRLLASRANGSHASHEILTFESRSELGVDHVTLHIAQQQTSSAGVQLRRLHCQVELLEREGQLPLFQRIITSPVGSPERDESSFRDQFASHRARSTFHDWLWLNEVKPADPLPFLELLAPDALELQLGGRALHSTEEFEHFWREDAHTHANAHRVDHWDARDQGDDKYEVIARVHWSAGSVSGLNEHRWRLRETRERYPRIESLVISEVPAR